MVDMVHADVRREPAQNSRQVVIRASTKRRLMKIPFPAMRPERLLELMLYVKQPDPHRACKEHYGQVHEQEWPDTDKPDQRGGRDGDRKIGRYCADPRVPAAADRANRESMTQEEYVGG